MKSSLKYIAALACSAVLLSSCAVHGYPMYTSGSVSVGHHGWSSTVAWTNARYDVNGFPIYGYYYGQPVYGYTDAGVAIFSIAALTAACLVPDWAPAPWYCGHWHYPRHVHRVSVPPRFPAGHHPGAHPGAAHHFRPARPAAHAHGPKPGVHRPQASHRPQMRPNRPQASHRPQVQPNRPQVSHRPQVQPNRPQVSHRPQVQPNRPQASHRPQARPNRPRVGGVAPLRGGGRGGHGGHRR